MRKAAERAVAGRAGVRDVKDDIAAWMAGGVMQVRDDPDVTG